MDSRAPTYIFNFFAVFGLFLLSVLLITASLSPQIRRSQTWYSMIMSRMVYAASYTLLLGHQFGPKPPNGICALQMVLVYASPTLTATTGLAFIVDVHLRLTSALFKKPNPKYTRYLLIIPWAIFEAVCAEALIAVHDFADIERGPDHMYCSIGSVDNFQGRLTAILCVIALGMAPLILWTMAILYRNWRLFRHM
ncbi:hypothetical protein FB45DRAFT_887327, partial [Roridomyces roridus]